MPTVPEKEERKKTDIVPITPGSSLMTWRRPGLLERDFDFIFDDFRRSFDSMMARILDSRFVNLKNKCNYSALFF